VKETATCDTEDHMKSPDKGPPFPEEITCRRKQS